MQAGQGCGIFYLDNCFPCRHPPQAPIPVKKQLPIIFIAFILPITAMLWWWGLFSTPKLQIEQAGDYHYAYLEAQGVYSKLGETLAEVKQELDRQGISHGAEVTLVMTDPRKTKPADLLARTGYMIPADAKLQSPLKSATIPKREVVAVSIKAHPLLAYGKTYGALLDYTNQHHSSLQLPTLEIFENSVLRVEMPLSHEPQDASP